MRHRDVRFARLAPFLALFMLTGAATDARAQHHGHGGRGARSVLGVQFMWAEPQGDFGYFVDNGFGMSGHAVFNLGRHGVAGLRLDGSFIVYGHEHFIQPLSPSIPRVWVDVTTDNIIASGFIGPQITLGHGALRPYVHGGFGFSYFATHSSVDGDPYHHHSLGSTNFDDWTPAVTGGGGLYLALSRRVLLDLAAQYVHNGTVEYMREGGITEDPDGSLWFEVIESEANLWMWKLGVSFAIG
jgi:hypothetical protein